MPLSPKQLAMIVVLMAFASVAAADHPGGLVSLHRFDGDWKDDSCRGNEASSTFVGLPGFVSSDEGQAAWFVGGLFGKQVRLPVSLQPSLRPELTIGAWVDPDVVDARQVIIGHDDGGFDRTLLIDDRPGSSWGWSAFTGTGVLNSGVAPVAGQWTFVAVVYDQNAGTVRLHVDGQSFNAAGAPGSGIDTTWIGWGLAGQFNGAIDNAFVFDRALTEPEIDAIRLGGSAAILAEGDAVLTTGQVRCEQKISPSRPGDPTSGVNPGLSSLTQYDEFGRSIAPLGDLDHDGLLEMAVGAPVAGTGSLWLLGGIGADRVPSIYREILPGQNGFIGTLDNLDLFAHQIASLGDVDGDGVGDLAVSAPWDDDGNEANANANRGAVWILFLNSDLTVKRHQKISDVDGGLPGALADGDEFGIGLAAMGDLDGDGVTELAVAARPDGPGPADAGRVHVLFLHSDGTVKAEQIIGDAELGAGTLEAGDQFGFSMAGIGDLDLDGIPDLAVGARGDDDGGVGASADRGAVYILFLNADGSLAWSAKISDTTAGFGSPLDDGDWFGAGVTSVGDLNGDGSPDLVASAILDDDGNTGNSNRGAFYLLPLSPAGALAAPAVKVSDTEGGLVYPLKDNDWAGQTVSAIGDVDGDGVTEIAMGVPRTDDPDPEMGAVHLLSLEGQPAICGDQVLDPLEACDDGNAVDHDGCTACRADIHVGLFGRAEGGSITVNVDGVALVVVTQAGDSSTTVLQTIAAAINADPTLQSRGTIAVVQDGELIVNDSVPRVDVADPGLRRDSELAQTPRRIAYRGRLEGASPQVTLILSLYDAVTGGARAWGPEQHQVNPDAEGRFEIEIGASGLDRCALESDGTYGCAGRGDDVPDLDQLDVSALYLEVQVHDGGATTVLSPRHALLPAFHSTTAGRLVKESVGFDDLAEAIRRRLVPVGTVVAWPGEAASVPEGWLLCDDAVYETSRYPSLAALIVQSYGEPAPGFFQVPDYRGRFQRGLGGDDPGPRLKMYPGGTDGMIVGTVEADSTALPSTPFVAETAGAHRHRLWVVPDGTDLGSPVADTFGGGSTLVPTSDDGAHMHEMLGGDAETRPENAAVHFIIKY